MDDEGHERTDEELRRRYAANLDQLDRMCRHPAVSRAEDGPAEQVDDDNLERELAELEDELREDMSGR